MARFLCNQGILLREIVISLILDMNCPAIEDNRLKQMVYVIIYVADLKQWCIKLKIF